jgi:hypothetical protein
MKCLDMLQTEKDCEKSLSWKGGEFFQESALLTFNFIKEKEGTDGWKHL